MKIRELMDRGTTAFTIDTRLDHAILTMRRLDRDVLPVTSPDGRMTLGILCESDITLALARHARPACEITTGEAMRTRGVMVAPDDDLRALCACMAHHRARRVPVVDANGHLEGTVGVEELLRRVAVSRRFGGEPSAKDVLETMRALFLPAHEPHARSDGTRPAAAKDDRSATPAPGGGDPARDREIGLVAIAPVPAGDPAHPAASTIG